MLLKDDKPPKVRRKRRSAKKEEEVLVAVEADAEKVNEKVEELLKEEL